MILRLKFTTQACKHIHRWNSDLFHRNLTHTTLTLSQGNEREINRNIRIQLAALKLETERIYEAIICSYKFDAVDVLDC